jgi:hypothetical protein
MAELPEMSSSAAPAAKKQNRIEPNDSIRLNIDNLKFQHIFFAIQR